MTESLEERLKRWLDNPDRIQFICDHVANGGSVVDLAQITQLPYNKIINWIQTNEDRSKLYVAALEARGEWAKERILKELRAIALFDIRQLFNSDGGLKPVDDWPEEAARAVAGIEVFEEFIGHGEDREHIGNTKKIKTIDKTRSLEMLMKNLAMLVERVDHSGKLTLGDIVAESQKKDEKK